MFLHCCGLGYGGCFVCFLSVFILFSWKYRSDFELWHQLKPTLMTKLNPGEHIKHHLGKLVPAPFQSQSLDSKPAQVPTFPFPISGIKVSLWPSCIIGPHKWATFISLSFSPFLSPSLLSCLTCWNKHSNCITRFPGLTFWFKKECLVWASICN